LLIGCQTMNLFAAGAATTARAGAGAAFSAAREAQADFSEAAMAIKSSEGLVWQPINNKFFETFSFLPPLDDKAVAKQVDYIVNNGWTPCLEFSDASTAYTANTNTVRMGAITPGYYDNRYWTMWKLPMFGCTDPSQVIKEIAQCTKAFPNAYVRIVAFDAKRQVQIAGFLVQRPKSAVEWAPVEKRSVA